LQAGAAPRAVGGGVFAEKFGLRPDANVPDLQRLPLEAIVQWNA